MIEIYEKKHTTGLNAYSYSCNESFICLMVNTCRILSLITLILLKKIQKY